MIHFALPWLFGAGVLGAATITALHFLSVRRPPELLLPTARFLEEGRVRAVSRSAQPSDLLLLLLRVAALLLASAAFAVPQWVSRSHRVARLIVADGAMRKDSVALLQGYDANGASNMLTRFVWTDSVDVTGAPSGLRAELSAALPIAVRAATALSAELNDVDSIALHVVAPSSVSANAESWRVWRAVWPGAVHVRQGGTILVPAKPVLRFDGVGADDALRSAFSTRFAESAPRQPGRASQAATRNIVVRRATSAATAAADTSVGAATIVWPESGAPNGWQPMRDTVGAVAAHGRALVASWARASRPSDEALRGARPIAWWSDGAVAATERANGNGCSRDVGIVVPPSSDILLDANADGLMAALTAPCASTLANWAAIPASILTDRLDRTRGAAAAASYFRSAELLGVRSTPGWLAPTLLAIGMILLLVEWFVRARGREAASTREDSRRAGVVA